MLSIKVLGPGCANCDRLEKVVRDVVAEMALDATIEKVKDHQRFLDYGLIFTPGLVVDEKLVCGGRIPSRAEVTSWLMTALEQSN